jgi:hypothetical protein
MKRTLKPIVAMLSLLAATTAYAITSETTVISTYGTTPPTASEIGPGQNDYAAGFILDSPIGFKSADLWLEAWGEATLTVSLYGNASGVPDQKIIDLTGPTNPTGPGSYNYYLATPKPLDPGTYWLVASAGKYNDTQYDWYEGTGTPGSNNYVNTMWLRYDKSGNPIGWEPSYLVTPAAFQINAAPVPEPETYAMLLVGLGMLGWIGRRARAV